MSDESAVAAARPAGRARPELPLRAPVPDAPDTRAPSVARVDDYALGGKDHYA